MNKQSQKKPSAEAGKHSPADAAPHTLAPAETTETSLDQPASDRRQWTSKLPSHEIQAFTDGELDETLKALRTEVRRRETERESLRPKAGSTVRILNGRPKYVGKVGTALIVRRSRCFVAVPEISSPAYVLISDLELVKR